MSGSVQVSGCLHYGDLQQITKTIKHIICDKSHLMYLSLETYSTCEHACTFMSSLAVLHTSTWQVVDKSRVEESETFLLVMASRQCQAAEQY